MYYNIEVSQSQSSYCRGQHEAMYNNIEGSQSHSALIIESNMKLCIIIWKVLNHIVLLL